MKNRFKLVGVIALVAVIGFGVLGCDSDDDNGDENGGGVWTVLPEFPDIKFNGVAWGANKFVAVGMHGANNVFTSADGITWTPVENSTDSYDGIVWGGDKFVAWSGAYGATSADGITWTSVTQIWVSQISKIIWVNDKFFGLTSSSTIYSTDGETWESLPPGISEIRGIAYGNGRYVAFGRTNQVYSTDGINWTNAGNIVMSNGVRDITWGNNKFIAVGLSGYGNFTLFSSSNGESWIEENSDVSGSFIVWANNKFYVFGTDVLTSSDGVTWTNAGNNNAFPTDIIWANNKFVGVGSNINNGVIAYWSGN